MRHLIVLCSLVLTPAFALAADLSGTWELQSLGGDRTFVVEHKGKRLVAHRVMWPEFEGEKYRLEHLYRGKVRGSSVRGELLVKEDELPDFEVLRSFTGTIEGDDKIVIDGLPLKRVGAAQHKPPQAPPSRSRPSEPPRHSSTPTPPPDARVAQASAPPSPKAPAPAPSVVQAPAADDSGAALFESIMGGPGGGNQSGLLRISATVVIPDTVADLTAEGDALMAAGKARAALKKYRQAQQSEGGRSNVQLWHRIGRCHLVLGDRVAARTPLKRALRLDPNNVAVRRDYRRAGR